MLLKNKVAVIYGAGGSIGGAVARAFARDGATLFLTGHVRAPIEAIAKDIVSAGGSAEAAEVDALVERSIDSHLQSVMDKAGRVDISFNAVGIPDAEILGVPLLDLGLEQILPTPLDLRGIVLGPRSGALCSTPTEKARGRTCAT